MKKPDSFQPHKEKNVVFAEEFLERFAYYFPFIAAITVIILTLFTIFAVIVTIVQSFGQTVQKDKLDILPQRHEVAVLSINYGHNESHKSAVGALECQVYRYKCVPGTLPVGIEATSHRRIFAWFDGYRLDCTSFIYPTRGFTANKAATSLQLPFGRNRKTGHTIPFGAPYAKQMYWNPVDVVNIEFDAIINAPQPSRDLWKRARAKLIRNRLCLLDGKDHKAKGCTSHNSCCNNFNDSQIVHTASLLWHHFVDAQEVA